MEYKYLDLPGMQTIVARRIRQLEENHYDLEVAKLVERFLGQDTTTSEQKQEVACQLITHIEEWFSLQSAVPAPE